MANPYSYPEHIKAIIAHNNEQSKQINPHGQSLRPEDEVTMQDMKDGIDIDDEEAQPSTDSIQYSHGQKSGSEGKSTEEYGRIP